MTEWRSDMENAPRGERILVYPCQPWGNHEERLPGSARWDDAVGRWVCDPNEATEYDYGPLSPTHWMPLPAPPKETDDE